jgi:Protein of unknown function (DUF4058)
MPSPFPGMDPYLEKPGLWPDVHHSLISNTQALLSQQVGPKHVVRVEERTYIADESDASLPLQIRVPDGEVSGRPDWEEARMSQGAGGAQLEVAEPVIATTWFEEEIHQAFLKILDRESRDVVTVIEILSPTNKIPGSAGRRSFEEKRREVMNSPSHWVEIDLLRGSRMVPVSGKLGPHEYLVHISTTSLRPRGKLFPIRLAQRLPIIPIPLKPEDPDARLDLQMVLDSAYDRAGYDLEIDYRVEPRPTLEGPLSAWSDELLRSKGLR